MRAKLRYFHFSRLCVVEGGPVDVSLLWENRVPARG